MADDRARDSRRVPSLGISEPISHVNVVSANESPKLNDHKWTVDHAEASTGIKHVSNRKDSKGKTWKGVSDYYHKDNARIDENALKTFSERDRAAGKTKVIKINSNN